MKFILRCFETFSGLSINFKKSCIVRFGVNEEFLYRLTGLCKCKVGVLPIYYLGIPLGVDSRRVATSDVVVEKFRKKLAGWKCRSMSWAARIVLICRPKENGGAGVVNLEIKNKALLAKWRWRVMVDKNALWSKVILAKYGSNAKQWRFGVNNLKDMSTVWRGIVENSFDVRVNRWIGDKDFKWKGVRDDKSSLGLGEWCGIDPGGGGPDIMEAQQKWEWEKTDHLFFNCIFINGFWKRIFNWWDIGWKKVNNFEDFYSCCFKVKILGSCKSLWLIAIVAAVWSIWLARNEMVFDNKVLTMDTLVFHAKMRALLWSRAAFDECRFHERLWWFCPYKCCLSKSDPGGWCFPPHGWFKFNVSGPIDAGDAESTELGAIIIALDIIIEIGWKRTGSLIIEIGSREVLSWILEKTRRRWSHQVIFAELERRWSRVGDLSFSATVANGNEMADSLAIAGANRTSMFKAWW
ncbi:hypothetical protein PVK06_018354 [Gossypium arboreum]|uniref:RNase H type-1 domain-containing protein n=1 Tax=Gossypium arboreum TaxID=29729 RepID=A0ABR0Q568_GOSAR|nr:hypothetical protein PVK06_018354 [Gossypium arboreum]